MGFIRSARLAVFGLSAACSVLGSGCAAERDPIDRVQLGALPKTFFLGQKLDDPSDDPEFYFRTTVVDVAAGAGSEELFTSTDAQPTVRIRWEITESTLIGRLAYELIDATDGRGTAGGPRNDEPRAPKSAARPTNDGQIVCAFAITKHFDIRRDYNPQTGEEANVVLENDTDRVYNQREYIRVDWSKNQITDAYDLDAVSQMGLWGGVKWDPVAYYVNDPLHPDAPVLDLEGGYLDVTTKAYASPQMVHDDEFGDFPACLLAGSFPRISCNPSEVKLRHAFRRVTDTDYEPLDFDGKKMELFGFFTVDRFGYDRRYGVVDEKWHRFASRWNLYERSHVSPAVPCNTPETTPVGLDPSRDADEDGTDDECATVGRGSRCDVFERACTVPLRDRKVRTIPWFVNRDFPAELFDSIKGVVEQWSDAMRVAVLAGRLAECRRTKDDDCESAMGWPKGWSDEFVPPVGSASSAEVPRVFVLCHNPVDPKLDDAACGAAGASPRLGDLRYNSLTYVVNPQAQAPWGIMVDAEDPLTGEKISGSVNQWGSTLDRAAGQLADLVLLLNGATSPQSFIAGEDVTSWVRESTKGGATTRPAPMSAEELAGRLAAFDPKVMAPLATATGKARSGSPVLRHRQRMRELAAAGKVGAGDGAILERLARLRGSEIEAKMVTPDLAQLAGHDPTQPITKGVIERASPLSRTSPHVRRALERRALLARARRHACRHEAPDADHLLGLAHEAQALFGTADPKDAAAVQELRDKIYQWARREFAAGVFSHEFGHSMGLRHNFAGTFDAVNFDNRYWQLRTRDKNVTRPCSAGNTDGSSCIGPRYSDPLTQAEIDGGINGYATSSVMDYPGDQALDMYILGKYDRAALRFGYGGTVDVWATQGMQVQGGSTDGTRKAYTALGLTDTPGLFGVRYFPQPGKDEYRTIHYSQLDLELGIIEGCKPDADSPLGTSCRGAPLDVVDLRQMKDFAPIPDYASFATQRAAVDPQGRVRRGYMFSSDEYADSGNVPSFRYDAGADAYEQIRFLESAYENRYVLDAFRRGRTTFNSWDVVARMQGHYLDTIQLLGKTFAFAMVLENDDPTRPAAQLLDDGNYGPLAVGASVAFDVFTRMLTRPEPGSYCSTAADTCPGLPPFGLVNDIYVADPDPQPAKVGYDFTVPLGRGRYVHNDFDYGQGYWWGDYQKQVGSFYEKVWAVYYLSEAFDSFISNSKEDFVDGRYKNVNFATIYPSQMRRLFGSLLTGDADTYAPWAQVGTGAGTPGADVAYPAWRTVDGLGTRPTSPKLLDPIIGFNEQLFMMTWGTLFLPTAWNDDFIKDARITALASEQISWPATETYVFVDPATSITYRAHATGTEKLFGVDKQKAVGARMLEWANDLVCVAYLCQTDAQGFILLNLDGTPKLKLDAQGKPQVDPEQPGGVGALKRYVTQIDVMRQLVSTYVRPAADTLPQ